MQPSCAITLLVSLTLATPILATSVAAAADADAPLYDNMGAYGRTITTDSKLAQDYFDQGLRLAYGFARDEAASSFRAAQQHDPGCAMCYWGEAWVLGPYQNNPDGVGSRDAAYTAARQALYLAEQAQPWEQALIGAMAVRYPETGGTDAQDFNTRTYADAMQAVAIQHPDDPDLHTLYAESLSPAARRGLQ